jgi:hypothetical protein
LNMRHSVLKPSPASSGNPGSSLPPQGPRLSHSLLSWGKCGVPTPFFCRAVWQPCVISFEPRFWIPLPTLSYLAVFSETKAAPDLKGLNTLIKEQFPAGHYGTCL